MISYSLVGIHKRKALFDNEVLEESFDVTVTTRTAFCGAFEKVDYFFFWVIVVKILIGLYIRKKCSL